MRKNIFRIVSEDLIDKFIVGTPREMISQIFGVPLHSFVEDGKEAIFYHTSRSILKMQIEADKVTRCECTFLDHVVNWDEAYKVGIDTVDHHHEHLFELFQMAYGAFTEHQINERVAAALHEIIRFASYHFRAEERLMLSHGYPKVSAHLQKHKRLLDRLKDYHGELVQGKTSVREEDLHFLQGWMVGHILKSDAEFGHFVEKQKKHSVGAADHGYQANKKSIDVELLTSQQEKLFESFNTSYDVCVFPTTPGEKHIVLRDLIEQATHLFALERVAMEEAEFPKMAEHLKEHENFLNQIHKIETGAAVQSLETADDLLALIHQWLNHTLTADAEYGRYKAGFDF